MMNILRKSAVVVAAVVMAVGCRSGSSGLRDGGGQDDTSDNADAGGGDAGADTSSADLPAGDASSPLTFAPSNIFPNQIAWQGLQDVDLTAECRAYVELGRIECGSSPIKEKISYSRQLQAGAGALGVFAMKSLRIEPGASLTVVGNLPLVLVAAERIDVMGTIIGSAHKQAAIGGGFSAFNRNPSGAGPGGGASGAPGYNGGGGGSHCGVGGAGATDSSRTPAFAAAKGGASYGVAELVPLMGGSSGGGSADESEGGGGGGAIQLVAGTEIVVAATGVISVSGGGARPGGGGGSGGAVLIEAPKATVTGTLAANGGGGGIFAGGGGGQDGTATATAAAGETAATAGGGSAATMLNGSAGLSTSANNTSGGGGGAGRFRINTTGGIATMGDKLSPAAGTACVTVGTLRPVTDKPATPAIPRSTITFKPSNVDLTALAAMDVDDMVLTNHCVVDVQMGRIECGNSQPIVSRFAFAQATQPGAGKVAVVFARSLRVEPGAELEIKGNLPLVFAAPGQIAIHGAINGRAVGVAALAGGFAAVDGNGAGPGGGGAGTNNYHGGGGGAYCGDGGAGAAPAGQTMALGGKATGSPTLVPLLGGSSGGGSDQPGGAGGGAIQLISGSLIDIGLGGLIDVAGGGQSTGSGGGSGGAILLEAPLVSLRGLLAANGGGGGVFAGGPGGSDGRSSTEAAMGERPDTAGKGSSAASPAGEAGISVTNNATSGGGGGAGRIRINTTSGQATLNGSLSPTMDTGCVTVGTTS